MYVLGLRIGTKVGFEVRTPTNRKISQAVDALENLHDFKMRDA